MLKSNLTINSSSRSWIWSSPNGEARTPERATAIETKAREKRMIGWTKVDQMRIRGVVFSKHWEHWGKYCRFMPPFIHDYAPACSQSHYEMWEGNGKRSITWLNQTYTCPGIEVQTIHTRLRIAFNNCLRLALIIPIRFYFYFYILVTWVKAEADWNR